MSNDDRIALDRIRASLYDQKLAQVKLVAPDAAAFAFEGVATWFDATSRVWAGGEVGTVESRMKGFLERFFPAAYEPHARALYDGLRNALLHEYGTRGVSLTHDNPGLHLQRVGGVLVLDIGSLIADCERAFEDFYAELEADPVARSRAVGASHGLLVPVRLVPTVEEIKLIEMDAHERAITFSALAASATSGTVRPADWKKRRPGSS